MDLSFVNGDTGTFDAQTYLRILIAIAKADPDNSFPEFDYIRRQACRLGLDFDALMQSTNKNFTIAGQAVTRLTALAVLSDAIMLASLDGNFSLPERQRVYGYAEKLDIARKDVDALERLISELRLIGERWNKLAASA